MKKSIILREDWQIKSVPSKTIETELQLALGNEGDWLEATMPAQLYTVLRQNSKIPDLLQTGRVEPYLEQIEQDWVYRTEFTVDKTDLNRRCLLCLDGVDTYAEVYLNGEHLAECRDLYLPVRIENPPLQEKNVLCVYFHSPLVWMQEQQVPECYTPMGKPKMQRIDSTGFSSYLGAKPMNRPLGLYDDVHLDFFDDAWLETPDVRVDVSPGCIDAYLSVSSAVAGKTEGASVLVELVDPDGKQVVLREQYPSDICDYSVSLHVKKPKLWWPRGYGEQYLYSLIITLVREGEVLHRQQRTIGFRRVTVESTLAFKINGKRIRLWGSNVAPLHAHDYTYDPDRMRLMFDYAELANMNSLRIWGGGAPFKDDLYEEADRRGLILWQDLFHNWGNYPDTAEFRSACCAEAENLVMQLKHHPSIILWCGGNESYLGSESDDSDRLYGWEIFEIDYPSIVRRLDPTRPYHQNSPYGGDYANDPSKGDSHVYSHIWFNRGFHYPLFQTENTRVFAPHLRSLTRMLGEENLWEEGYTGQVKKPGDYAFPSTWHERALMPDYLSRLPPIEYFYEADNAEALVYRLGAAYAWFMRDSIERVRRGRPADDVFGERRCQGHYNWRLFDSWPQIFCSLIDYYNEPSIAYYAIQRAFTPLLLSFDITDHIYVWLVNDTAEAVQGTLTVRLFDPDVNQCIKTLSLPVRIGQDQSMPFTSLDSWGEFRRKCFLYAEFVDEKGNVLARANDYLDIERKLMFPKECTLTFSQEGEKVYIQTSHFARCVELAAEGTDGDDFGWIFKENYFDLFPWEKKVVELVDDHIPAKITAKARFSTGAAELKF